MEEITLKNYSHVTIIKMLKSEINKIDFALCKQPTETLEQYYNRQEIKPTLICNGGLFTMSNGNTEFTYVDEHKLINKRTDILDGFAITDSGELINTTYNESYKDFISGYPVLIKNGQLVSTWVGSELNYNARRTVLAYDKDNVYLIAVELPGMNFTKLKALLLELNVTDAINLDGGGSTRILHNGKRITESTSYNRPVDNVVCFYLKDGIKEQEATKPIYRVQTGAFSIQLSANNYRNKIQKLPDELNVGYKNAYVRKLGNLYKVQVGAFSIKANADKVVADLKAKGFNAFVTTE